MALHVPMVALLLVTALPTPASGTTSGDSHSGAAGPDSARVIAWRLKMTPGARIRVTNRAFGPPMTGRFVSMTGDSLVFEPGELARRRTAVQARLAADRLAIPLERTRVQLSVARHNRLGEGAIFGAAFGFAVGGIVVLATQASYDIGDVFASALGGSFPSQRAPRAPLFIGLAAGGAAGALMGASMSVDTWVPVQLGSPVSFAITPGGGLRVAISAPVR